MEDIFEQSEELNKTPNVEKLFLSSLYRVNEGGFGDRTSGIKTYCCALNIGELKQDITTFNKLTEDNVWPVSQIIQREIDYRRVEEISSHYIRGKGRDIKYFPPLTIAILPRDENNRISKEYEYDDIVELNHRNQILNASMFRGNEKAKEVFEKASDLSPLKGFFVLEISKPFNYQLLCWDKTKYFAVVIDGQHRYEALLNSAEKDPSMLRFVQDVMFIDLSTSIKYIKQQENKDIDPVNAIRTVFVDINNSARMITPVRRILMDDKDLASLFVQSLVNDEDDDRTRSNEYILPQLIDWHVESYKHELPHITSILLLYQIITDYVLKKRNLSSIDDLRDKNKVKGWANLVNEKFRIDNKIQEKILYENYTSIEHSLQEYLNVVDEGADQEELDFIFSYDYRVLRIAQETFQDVYVKAIVKCFNELTPYKKVQNYLSGVGAFNSTNILYRALVSTKTEIDKKPNYKSQLEKHKQELKDSLNNQYELLYTVLGQKTLFDLFFRSVDYDYDQEFDNEKAINVATRFIKKINELLDILSYSEMPLFGTKDSVIIPSKYYGDIEYLGTVVKSFWEGIIYQEKRIIYTSRGVFSMRSVIEYLLKYISSFKSNRQVEPLGKEEFKISYLKNRIEQIIIRQNPDFEGDASELAKKVVEIKRKFLNEYMQDAITKWEKANN